MPGFVAVAIFREIGPLITAVIVAGRVGAAFTARIGTMKVSEEILALETMAINPVRYLVVQRFIGMLIALPALTLLGELYRRCSAGFCSVRRDSASGRTPMCVKRSRSFCSGMSIRACSKPWFLPSVIVMIGCYRGLVVEGGAEEVGKATMLSVVSSTLAIIVLDTVMTAAFYG